MLAWSPPSVSQIRVVQYGWNEPERCVKQAILTLEKYSIGNSSILSGFTVLLWLISQRHTFQPDRLCVETVFDDQIHFEQRQKYKITNTILKTFCKLHILIAHCTNFIAQCTISIAHWTFSSHIANWWIPTAGQRTELVDSHSRSDATWSLFCEFWTL